MNKETIKQVADKLRKGKFQVPVGIKTAEAKIVAEKVVEYIRSIKDDQAPAVKARILEQTKSMSLTACTFLQDQLKHVETLLK